MDIAPAQSPVPAPYLSRAGWRAFLTGVLLGPAALLIDAVCTLLRVGPPHPIRGFLGWSLGVGFLLSVLAPWLNSPQPPRIRLLVTLGAPLFWAMLISLAAAGLGFSE